MIKITNQSIREYTRHACGQAPAEGKLFLFGFRSAKLYPTNDGSVAVSLVEPRPGEYDDLVGYGGPDLALFPGTVDPGRFYTLHPQRPTGCAHLASLDEGGWPYRYVRGPHKGKPAFKQAGSFCIWRDSDGDLLRDLEEAPHPESGNGIDIHRMGTLARDIGKWSAGCQGVMDRYWAEFYYAAATRYRQAEYLYWLMDFGRFARWFDLVRSA